jgi:hypothetical protein
MVILRLCSLGAAAILIFFLGCQHAAIAYRLRRDGLDPIVLPPTMVSSTSQSLSIDVKHARHANPKGIDCDVTGDLMSLRWAKSTAQISFRAETLFAPDPSSPNQVGRGMYVDPLLAVDKFRLDLVERESEGCLSALESERLRRAVVESMPLPPDIAYSLQLGSYSVSGYFDLTPDFRMQVTSPIYAAGSEPSTSSLLGYETANYAFTAERNLMRPRLISATETLIGAVPIEKQTVRNELPFGKSPAYFRLVFKTEEGLSTRVTRAILLSSRSQMRLTQAVAHRASSVDDFCATLSISQVNCTVLPKNFGVSPELRIRVNQKDAFVRVGGMVRDVLDLGIDAAPPASLQILRPFHGHLIPIEFDRSSKDILNLLLLPGDELRF